MTTSTNVSPAPDLVIRGGTVIAGSDTLRAAVAVREGRIIALCEDDAAPPAEREFDASGKLVLPGAIDAHFHHRHLIHSCGTHLDAPYHFFPDPQTVDEIPLEKLMGPGIKLDVKHRGVPRGEVTVDDLKAAAEAVGEELRD